MSRPDISEITKRWRSNDNFTRDIPDLIGYIKKLEAVVDAARIFADTDCGAEFPKVGKAIAELDS